MGSLHTQNGVLWGRLGFRVLWGYKGSIMARYYQLYLGLGRLWEVLTWAEKAWSATPNRNSEGDHLLKAKLTDSQTTPRMRT